jgi:hypothetical protein
LCKNLKIKIKRSLPAELHEFEIWYLSLKEEHRLNVSGKSAEKNIWI